MSVESENQGVRNKEDGTVGPAPCQGCGSPLARTWDAPDGPAQLCQECATLAGLGCP